MITRFKHVNKKYNGAIISKIVLGRIKFSVYNKASECGACNFINIQIERKKIREIKT